MLANLNTSLGLGGPLHQIVYQKFYTQHWNKIRIEFHTDLKKITQ